MPILKPDARIQPEGPHNPANCALKGLFGRDCKNCDRSVPPYTKIRKEKRNVKPNGTR